MNTLRYPYPDPPPPGERLQVAPGVYWLRFPLPFALDHINLWLLADGDGWTLVDTGLGGQHTRDLWELAFAKALADKPIQRIIVTHYHPDHVGQAAWLAARWRAPILMTAGEQHLAVSLYAYSDQETGAGLRALFGRHGLTNGALEHLAAHGNTYRQMLSGPPQQPEVIAAGDTIAVDGDAWRVHIGRGHTPEHACLYRERDRVLISGDQVLPRISSNLAVRPQQPDEDPVTEFVDSLRALQRALPADTLVLPAHGRPFRGLHQRIAALCAHHDAQLGAALDACSTQPRTAYDLLPVLFRRKLDGVQTMFAMGESIAHLNCLYATERVTRAQRDGRWYFSARHGVPTAPPRKS